MLDGLEIKKILCSVILAALVTRAAAAAEEPQIHAQLDRHQVYEGQSVRYKVLLSNIDGLILPELKGFDDFDVTLLDQHTTKSTRITVTRGQPQKRVNQELACSYRLTPRKTGILQIPSPTASVDGHVLRGNPLSLEVRPPVSQDVAVLEILIDRCEIHPMQEATVTLAVMVKRLPPPFDDREPIGVRPNPPTLMIPWMIDWHLPAGLKPGVGWGKWMDLYENRKGLGFQFDGVVQRPAIDLFQTSKPIFRPTPNRVIRRDKEGKETVYLRYEFVRTFLATKPGAYRFGPVTLEGMLFIAEGNEPKLVQKEIFAMARPVVLTCKDFPADRQRDRSNRGSEESTADKGEAESPKQPDAPPKEETMLRLLREFAPPSAAQDRLRENTVCVMK